MSDDEREEKELDLSSAEVVTKYKTAAEIVNSVFLTLLLLIFVVSNFIWVLVILYIGHNFFLEPCWSSLFFFKFTFFVLLVALN